jgi:hypothetical protein
MAIVGCWLHQCVHILLEFLQKFETIKNDINGKCQIRLRALTAGKNTPHQHSGLREL